MSRSYKKQIHKQRNDKCYKKLSNRLIRRYKDIVNGKFFKRILDPWDICDWAFKSDDEKDRRK